jgi:hypothetical protein
MAFLLQPAIFLVVAQSWSQALIPVKRNFYFRRTQGKRCGLAIRETSMKNVNPLLAFLLGAAIVGLGVLGYWLYERQNRQVLKIDVPGFSGEITKDDGKGIDIEVGKDR